MRKLLRVLLFTSPFMLGCLPPAAPTPLYEDLPPPRVLVTNSQLVLNQAIHFEFDQARILPISFPILDEVARALKQNPDISRMRIEGHTDNVGTPAYNLNLSRRRAQAVLQYLRERSISEGRLNSVGFGQSQPIAGNDTEQGRAINRRVSFVIEAWQTDPGTRHAQK